MLLDRTLIRIGSSPRHRIYSCDRRIARFQAARREMKHCRLCDQDLPMDAFAPRRAQCRECRRVAQRAHYYNFTDWEQRRAYQHAKYARAKEIVLEIKSNPCTDCGGRFPPYVMHFDHRDPSQKRLSVSALTGAGHVRTLLAEIAKCDLVCANCHAIRTHRQREAGVIRPGRPRIHE